MIFCLAFFRAQGRDEEVISVQDFRTLTNAHSQGLKSLLEKLMLRLLLARLRIARFAKQPKRSRLR